MTGTKRVVTPLFTPPLEDTSTEAIATEFYYQSRVGFLIYAATCCRHDIQFQVNFVSQGNQIHNEAMIKTVDGILSYVVQTKHVGLSNGGSNTNLILTGYCDASFGANEKKGRLTIILWVDICSRRMCNLMACQGTCNYRTLNS